MKLKKNENDDCVKEIFINIANFVTNGRRYRENDRYFLSFMDDKSFKKYENLAKNTIGELMLKSK